MSGKGVYDRSSPVSNKSARRDNSGRPSRVGSILSASFASLGITAKIKEHGLKKIWTKCVGENISKRARPMKLVGATLYCTVSSSPWMAELNYQKSEIITKINKKLGESAVSAIVFKIGPMTESSPSAPPQKMPKALTAKEKDFIEESAGRIKDGSLRDLIKRVMEKAKSQGLS